MIKSPLIQELLAERIQKDIIAVLLERFGGVPREILDMLESVHEENRLEALLKAVIRCPDLEAFRVLLTRD